jgi:hypothetical protein
VGLSDAAVREGVTEATRAETIRVLEQKINEAGHPDRRDRPAPDGQLRRRRHALAACAGQ